LKIYFSDFFGVPQETIERYGAFNVSLINDLPVFIDPFLLFNSEKAEYNQLHEEMIRYLRFLRDMSQDGAISPGLLRHWFLFPEVKQNWLGYSKIGNGGAGLGKDFAAALNASLGTIFRDFGAEKVTKGSHLEKLCLVKGKVGRDNISDFTTNLIKRFLCKYTEDFAKQYLRVDQLRKVSVPHSSFDYESRRWAAQPFVLPFIDGNYVLLTPKDILTKDEAWINKHDLVGDFEDIIAAISNEELRAQISDFFLRQLTPKSQRKEIDEAAVATLKKYPEVIEYYIKLKEDHGEKAVALSKEKVGEVESTFIANVKQLVSALQAEGFYGASGDTLQAAYNRVMFLKQVIENNDGYRFFYVKGQPVKREQDLQLIYRLTWYAALEDVNSEVNNGRGPVDYKISRGSSDKTLVEFKLAGNSKLKQNLANQVAVYEAANQTVKSIKVILYFSVQEHFKVRNIMKDLNLKEGIGLVLIDASREGKESASNVA
jgi:hypothetical protein